MHFSLFLGKPFLGKLLIQKRFSYSKVSKLVKPLFVKKIFYNQNEINNILQDQLKSTPDYKNLLKKSQNEVKKFVNASSTSSMFFTDTNRVFGFGRKSLMGIGDESTELVQTPMELNIMDNGNKIEIDNIVAGSNFYIVIDKEGKVYGTGSNSNGILGRWIGIDRKQPNSRYKTAFEWVECPELEI